MSAEHKLLIGQVAPQTGPVQTDEQNVIDHLPVQNAGFIRLNLPMQDDQHQSIMHQSYL